MDKLIKKSEIVANTSLWDRSALPIGMALAMGTGALAAAVTGGMTAGWDTAMLRAAGQADANVAVGGWRWATAAAWDVSAFGGLFFVALFAAGAAGWMLLRGRLMGAVALVAAVAGSEVLTAGLKALVPRIRPTSLQGLTPGWEASSFASGYALRAAALYGVMAALVVMSPRVERRLKAYAVAAAGFLIVAVGTSRIWIGTEYASDVVVGWSAGLIWMLVCVELARMMRQEAIPARAQSVEAIPASGARADEIRAEARIAEPAPVLPLAAVAAAPSPAKVEPRIQPVMSPAASSDEADHEAESPDDLDDFARGSIFHGDLGNRVTSGASYPGSPRVLEAVGFAPSATPRGLRYLNEISEPTPMSGDGNSR